MTVSDIFVEYYDESAGAWKTIDARSWKVDKDGPQSFWEFELVTDKSLLGEIPAESDIRAKNQGVWVFAGRTDDGGELNQNGNFELTAHSYGHKQLRDRITISKNSNNTNLDIMTEIVNNIQYRADDGTLKTYNLNTPSTSYDLPNYSYDGKAKNAKQEMERWFNWTLYTAPRGEAYYEPIEHGSSGVTIDTSTDNASIDKYKPEITENVVSDVRVTGTDPSGNKIDKLASASSPDAVNYVHKRVDFNISSSEAQTLVDEYLQPSATDRVEIFLRFQDYQDTFFNESIDFSDPERTNGNTETFFVHEEEITQSGGLKLTLEKAPNFSIITEFDDQEKDLERNRKKVFFGDTSNVTGKTGDTGPDVDGSSGDTAPNVAGSSSTDMSDSDNANPQDQGFAGMTSSDTFSDTVDVPYISGNAPIIFVYFTVQARADNPDFVGGQAKITNTTKNVTLHDEGSTSTSYQPGDFRIFQAVEAGDGDLEGDTIEFEWDMTSDNGGDDDMRFSYGLMVLGDHSHGSGSYDADNHPHGDGSYDADLHPHGDGSYDADLHPHDGQGSLEADKTTEDKTDR